MASNTETQTTTPVDPMVMMMMARLEALEKASAAKDVEIEQLKAKNAEIEQLKSKDNDSNSSASNSDIVYKGHIGELINKHKTKMNEWDALAPKIKERTPRPVGAWSITNQVYDLPKMQSLEDYFSLADYINLTDPVPDEDWKLSKGDKISDKHKDILKWVEDFKNKKVDKQDLESYAAVTFKSASTQNRFVANIVTRGIAQRRGQ
jgi:hypothetical protein